MVFGTGIIGLSMEEFTHARTQKRPVKALHLQLRLCAVPSDGALDEAVGVALRRIDLSVFASVLEALEPAEICGFVSS